ncbi:MAG: type II toxin-antitoxin system VapC family toxin [Vicinamibacteria bacterium]|nr:type II toxin-antitoxin system VapC family toxin [Vicinamibacteria bacterium]
MPTAASRHKATPASAAGSVRYLETSAVLAALLEGDVRAKRSLRGPGDRVTSALTFTEAQRGLRRSRHDGRLTADQERRARRALAHLRSRCTVVAITDEVLAGAGRPFPVEPVRTLDALHLATIALVADAPEFITVVTRDARVRDNAAALGCAVE